MASSPAHCGSSPSSAVSAAPNDPGQPRKAGLGPVGISPAAAVEGTERTDVGELDTFHIERNRAQLRSEPRDVLRRRKDEFRGGIDEPQDEPGTRDAVDLRAPPGNPLHEGPRQVEDRPPDRTGRPARTPAPAAARPAAPVPGAVEDDDLSSDSVPAALPPGSDPDRRGTSSRVMAPAGDGVVQVPDRGRLVEQVPPRPLAPPRIASGVSSCFSGLSAPTAAMNRPGCSISAVRNRSSRWVQVTQMSLARTASDIASTGTTLIPSSRSIASAKLRARRGSTSYASTRVTRRTRRSALRWLAPWLPHPQMATVPPACFASRRAATADAAAVRRMVISIESHHRQRDTALPVEERDEALDRREPMPDRVERKIRVDLCREVSARRTQAGGLDVNPPSITWFPSTRGRRGCSPSRSS
jgi:hypothetical protein